MHKSSQAAHFMLFPRVRLTISPDALFRIGWLRPLLRLIYGAKLGCLCGLAKVAAAATFAL
jgi:hypothetical protein